MNAPPKKETAGALPTLPAADTKNHAAIVAPYCDDGKPLIARLKAAFACAGHAVHETADGGYLVCKFNLAKHCPDARALAAFAKLVGVRT